MTDTQFTALLTNLPAIITAFIAAVFAGLILWRQAAIAKKSDEKVAVLVEKTDQIHTMANGTLSRVSAELAVAGEKIAGMERLLAAQTLASATAVPAAPGVLGAELVLKVPEQDLSVDHPTEKK